MWTLRTDYLTIPLEHGNYSAIAFDTEQEAIDWWNCVVPIPEQFPKKQTLTDSSGNVVASRNV